MSHWGEHLFKGPLYTSHTTTFDPRENIAFAVLVQVRKQGLYTVHKASMRVGVCRQVQHWSSCKIIGGFPRQKIMENWKIMACSVALKYLYLPSPWAHSHVSPLVRKLSKPPFIKVADRMAGDKITNLRSYILYRWYLRSPWLHSNALPLVRKLLARAV